MVVLMLLAATCLVANDQVHAARAQAVAVYRAATFTMVGGGGYTH